MTRSAIWPFVVALVFTLGGCVNSPSSSSADDVSNTVPDSVATKKTGLLIEPADALKLGYSIDWVTSLNVAGDRDLFAVEVLGDLLVTVDRPTNVVTAVAMKDGKQLWRQQAGQTPYRAFAPTRVDDRILVNTETQIFEFDTTKEGQLINRADLASAVGAGPAMIGDVAVFGGSNGLIFGHDTRTGYARWRYKMPGQIVVAPQSSGQQVFVVGTDGQYNLFAGSGGEVLWRGKVFDKVTATPAVHASGIYVASEDHSLYAINRSTGEDRWIFRYTDDLTKSPVVLQNTVYQALPSGELVALKVTDGSEVWRNKPDANLVGQISRGLIFQGGRSITLRDAGSGKLIDQIPSQDELKFVIITEAKALIVIAKNGRIMKLSQLK